MKTFGGSDGILPFRKFLSDLTGSVSLELYLKRPDNGRFDKTIVFPNSRLAVFFAPKPHGALGYPVCKSVLRGPGEHKRKHKTIAQPLPRRAARLSGR